MPFSLKQRNWIGQTILLPLAIVLAAASAAGVARGQGPTKEQFEEAIAIELPEDPAAVIAVVGASKILLGDVKPKVDGIINDAIAKSSKEVPADEVKFLRVNLTRGLLRQLVQNKMMRESFLLSQVGTQAAEKREEASTMMSARARQLFVDSEVPELLKRHGVTDMTQLDEKLRAEGTSLHAKQREFTDAMLGHMYMRSAVEKEPEVSLAEIVRYYSEHHGEYEHKSQARWEQLTVYFKNFPSREAADQAIREMGREAYFGGSMQSVARQKSQEPLASSGGVHDWTNQGSLASDTLDQQIFSLPLNQLSEVIEDDNGFHIIRVLQRKAAGFIPLSELQEDIKKKIQQQKVAAAQRKMVDEMSKLVPVWTMFPQDFPGAKPLPKVARFAPATKLR
jgi:parvulin-like peptidyl-prolyl isomerase